MLTPAQVTSRLREAWTAAGLDLVHPVGRLALPPHLQLSPAPRPDALGLLVANSRALWPAFLASLAAEPSLARHPDPLDRYVERSMLAPLDALGLAHHVHWSHGPTPAPIQALAHASGLAHLGPTGLCVHPTHGPWIGLRALVWLDLPGPTAPPTPAPDPCAACARPCVPLFELAMDATPPDATRADVARLWRLWLAPRDACPKGRASRYGDAQIAFHYGVEGLTPLP